jgi:hypothetical protein
MNSLFFYAISDEADEKRILKLFFKIIPLGVFVFSFIVHAVCVCTL